MTTIPQCSSENRNLPPGPNSWQVLHFFTDLNVCNTWKLIASRIGSGWFSSTNSIINIRWYGNCWNSAWRISWSWNNTVATVPRTCQWMTKETFYVVSQHTGRLPFVKTSLPDWPVHQRAASVLRKCEISSPKSRVSTTKNSFQLRRRNWCAAFADCWPIRSASSNRHKWYARCDLTICKYGNWQNG